MSTQTKSKLSIPLARSGSGVRRPFGSSCFISGGLRVPKTACTWLVNFWNWDGLAFLCSLLFSGYCRLTGAARSLQNEGRSHWDFMKRRLRRIYPPFWLSILIVVSIPFVMTFLSYAKSGNFVLPSTSKLSDFRVIRPQIGLGFSHFFAYSNRVLRVCSQSLHRLTRSIGRWRLKSKLFISYHVFFLDSAGSLPFL